MSAAFTPFHRHYELPWTGDPDSGRRFRRWLGGLLLVLAVLGSVIPMLPLPKPTQAETSVPERLARVMMDKPKPPPPPPQPKAQEKPKEPEHVKPIPPKPVEPPKDLARQKAQKQLNRIKDDLADIRQSFDLSSMAQNNLSGSVMADSRAERSLITSRVGSGSGGIGSAPQSRNFGNGSGALGNHDTGMVTSTVGASKLDGRGANRTGGASGKAARSREEIETVFDRNKGAIYNLYNRALRENPALQGKVVLEFTISPGGEVTMCRVVSTELNNKDLEEKIIARVRLFHFQPRTDVESITTTKPIDFFPA
jgi:periplasmic protein TonB